MQNNSKCLKRKRNTFQNNLIFPLLYLSKKKQDQLYVDPDNKLQKKLILKVKKLIYQAFRKNLSISFATFRPEAIALTTRLAPLTESPAAKTFCRFVE